MRHEAIRLLYSNAVTIDDDAGVFDSDGNVVLINESLVNTQIAELQAAEPLRQLREQRNQKLAQSDWMAVSDRVMTQAQIDYRQSLRDLPETADPQLDENGQLTNVTWPSL